MADDLFAYETPARVMSPCVNVCRLDPRTRRCTGCARTAQEIAEWPTASDARRQAILDEVARR